MRLLRRVHRWLGLAVFIQVLIWIGSGLLISLLDAETAAGSTSRRPAPAPSPLPAGEVLPIGDLAMERAGLESVRLSRVDGVPVYRLVYGQGVRLLDARSGQPFTVTEERARRIASASYRGTGKIRGAVRIDSPEAATGVDGAAWRVDFSDALKTRVWIDARDGRLLRHRNDRSALVAFLLKLHFMDYGGGTDFNHPLIIAAAFVALWLAISGALLLITGLRRSGLR